MIKTIYAAVCGIFSAAVLAASLFIVPSTASAWSWLDDTSGPTVERVNVAVANEATFVPAWVMRVDGDIVTVVTDHAGPFDPLYGKYAVLTDPAIGDVFDAAEAAEYFGATPLLLNERNNGNPRYTVKAADGSSVVDVTRLVADDFITNSTAAIISDEQTGEGSGDSQF